MFWSRAAGDMTMKRCLLRALKLFAIIALLAVVVPVAAIEGVCRPDVAAWSGPTAIQPFPEVTERNYRRPELNTYFTFPESYVAYSFEDFGQFLDRGSESGFNYGSQIFGFWKSFCAINRLAGSHGAAPFDLKAKTYMIGISYSAEFAIKGAYENTIGRLTEWIRGPERTPQDLYARKVLQDYATFLYTIPWYKFPVRAKLDGLFAITDPSPSPVRTWERKFALCSEYLVRTGYAWLTQKGLDASGGEAPRDVMFVVRTLPRDMLAREPRIKVIRALNTDWQLVLVPRDKAFTDILNGILNEGYEVAEIAGNRNALVTLIVPDSPTLSITRVRELFSLPLDAKPGFRRVGLDAKIPDLVLISRELKSAGLTIERFYDY
jgi:hypothetical protein